MTERTDGHYDPAVWPVLREQALERDGRRCVACERVRALVVHHRRYGENGHAELGDLVTLCRGCHMAVHAYETHGAPLEEATQAVIDGHPSDYDTSGKLEALSQEATEAKAALDAAIVAERAKGTTLEAIAREVGWTRAGVLYVVRKAERP